MPIQFELARYGFIGDTVNGFKSRYNCIKFTPSGWVLSTAAGLLITQGSLSAVDVMFKELDSYYTRVALSNPTQQEDVKEFFDLLNLCAQKRNNPIIVPKQLPTSLSWTPMDAEWQETASRNWWSTRYRGRLREIDPLLYMLRDRLLSFGGDQACLPATEEDLFRILNRGQFWYGDKAKLMKGEASQCHRNSCNLWEANRTLKGSSVHIATGYALSKDGMWRQHSWLVHAKPRSNQIVETTVKRIGYYGFVMTTLESEQFCFNNY